MTSRAAGTVYALICVALWALIPVVAKIGQSNLDHHQFLFWSSAVSFIVLAAATCAGGKAKYLRRYTKKEWLHLSCLGLLGTYFYYLFLYLGYAKTAGIEVLVVQYTWPILIVVFSIFILNERLTGQKIIALVLGVTAVLLVLTKGNIKQLNINHPSVIALVAAGAACFALFSVLNKQVNKEPLGVITVYFLTASIASFISMLYFSEIALPAPREVAAVLLNGILVNGFSYVFWVLALRATDASSIAPLIFITPIVSAFYLVVLFDEPFLTAYAAGLLLAVAAGVITVWQPAKRG